MNILRIVYDWPPPWLGLAPAPYEMSVSQAKLGHKIDVFCGRWPYAGEVEKPNGIDIHTFWREPFPGTVTITSSVFMFFYYLNWRRTHTPDVIHSHDHFGIWLYLYRNILKKFLSKWSKELKTPLVVHFHNTVQGRWEKLKETNIDIKPHSKYVSYPLAMLANKWAVKAADALIFVSEDLKNDAIKYYNADPSKCFIVETGVNPNRFKPVGAEEKEKSRRELNLDMYDKVVMNYGLLSERKGIHLLVEALALLPANYKLFLLGSGDPSYLIRIDDKISSLKLKDRVVRAGYTPYPEIPIALQVSDIFVLPSSFEGLSKAVVESLACGIPALVSGFKVNDDIAGLYYLKDLSPQNIANQIKELVDHPSEVNIGKIMHYYSWDQKAKAVDKVYEYAKNKIF